jgi:hypothetical protein
VKRIKKIFNDLRAADKKAMAFSALVIISIPFFLKVSKISFGFYVGVAIGLLNFAWYRHIISKCTKQNVSAKAVVFFVKSTFIFKYLFISFMLYFLSAQGVINLLGVILGFTLILILFIYHLYNLTREERQFNATSPALY